MKRGREEENLGSLSLSLSFSPPLSKTSSSLKKKHSTKGVFSKYRASADASAVPGAQWREGVVWSAVGTCAAFAACGLLSLCRGVFRCCGGGDR